MISALLAGLVFFSLFVGRLSPVWLAVVCLVAAAIFLWIGTHHHNRVLILDVYARRSRLCRENAAFKTVASVVLLVFCICSSSPLLPLCLSVFLLGITVKAGGIQLREYLRLLALPAVFMLLSALTLLWDFYRELPHDTAFAVSFFGGWLAVNSSAQTMGILVLSRALGAVSCLYFLSLSTPLPELVQVMRRIYVPEIVIELAILIYRYIFILLDTVQNMKDSAASRLGYRGLKRSLYTTGMVYGGLLGTSFRRAEACFNAMESRCYAGQIAFLTEKKKVTGRICCLLGIPLAGMLLGIALGF